MSGFYRASGSFGQTWFSPVGGGAVPAAGGTIDTYLAGTLTPAPTYADATGGAANTNPIVLNAAGRLNNVDIWLSGGVAYKFVIKDAVGNPIATVDNIAGQNDPAFAAGSFGEWIAGPAATWITATSFSCAGDQASLGPLNQGRRIEITSGAGITRATITSTIYDVPTNRTTVTFEKDNADPAPTNPITALRYGLLSVPNPSFPSAALQLGLPRRRAANNTNVLLYGPIGSNLVAFTTPPDVVASAGGAGNQIIASGGGFLMFQKIGHGRKTGEVVQLTTSDTLPGNTAPATSYIVSVEDANNYILYPVPAGWQFEQPYLSPSNPGGLTWGSPIAYSSAGVGNQTVTPGFVAPVGVTRVYAIVTGAGGGSAGIGATTGAGGNMEAQAGGSGAGGGTSEGWLTLTAGSFYSAVIGPGGLGGNSGDNAGAAGASSAFSTLNATGGAGGKISTTVGIASLGGIGSGGTINLRGGGTTPGSRSVISAAGGQMAAVSQSGGGSKWGTGAPGVQARAAPNSDSQAAISAISNGAPGSGASGPANCQLQGGAIAAAQAGAQGAHGMITVSW